MVNGDHERLEALLTEWANNPCEDSLSALVRYMQPVVNHHAWTMWKRSRSIDDVDDLVQIANIGLIEAARRYDPDKGYFRPFAIQYMRGMMLNYLRDTGNYMKVGRTFQRAYARREGLIDEFYAQHGYPPSDEYIAGRMGMSLREYHRKTRLPPHISLEQFGAALSKDEDVDWQDMFGAEDEELNAAADILTLRAALVEACKPKEQQAVTLCYLHNYSQHEAAQVMGLSQMHVSRLVRSAITKLRTYIEDEKQESVPGGSVCFPLGRVFTLYNTGGRP